MRMNGPYWRLLKLAPSENLLDLRGKAIRAGALFRIA